jgi:hypothetical protein
MSTCGCTVQSPRLADTAGIRVRFRLLTARRTSSPGRPRACVHRADSKARRRQAAKLAPRCSCPLTRSGYWQIHQVSDPYLRAGRRPAGQ